MRKNNKCTLKVATMSLFAGIFLCGCGEKAQGLAKQPEPVPDTTARQEKVEQNDSSSGHIFECGFEPRPRFGNGDADLMAYLKDSIRYPEPVVKYGITGRVIMHLAIDTLGQATNVEVVRCSLNTDTEQMQSEPFDRQCKLRTQINNLVIEECTRLLETMPNWTPGYDSRLQKNVTVKYTLPININPPGTEQ